MRLISLSSVHLERACEVAILSEDESLNEISEANKKFFVTKVENLIHKTRINIIQDFIDGKEIKELVTVQKR